MYLKYWKLKSKPFENHLESEFYYSSSSNAEILAKLLYFVKEGKQVAVLTGEYGTGKTTIIHQLMHVLNPNSFVFTLLNTGSKQQGEIYRHILYEIDRTINLENRSNSELFEIICNKLTKHIQHNKYNVLIIDEAQLINDLTVFEDLRLLFNSYYNSKFLLSIILVGHTSLQDKLKNIPQFDQRISMYCELSTFNLTETIEYIKFRLHNAGCKHHIFSKESLKRIFEISEGIPRIINNICDLCLVTGCLKKASSIDSEVLESIYSKNEKIFQHNHIYSKILNNGNYFSNGNNSLDSESISMDKIEIIKSETDIEQFHNIGKAPNFAFTLADTNVSTEEDSIADIAISENELNNSQSQQSQATKVNTKVTTIDTASSVNFQVDVEQLGDAELLSFNDKIFSLVNQAFIKAQNNSLINLDEFDEVIEDIVQMATHNEDLLYTALNSSNKHTIEEHSINVAILAAYIGRNLNYCDDKLFELTLAALLHDIGLSQLPQETVYKKGKIADAEMEVIKQHPYYGSEILSSVVSTKFADNISWLTEVVFQEHEREGGIGYPQGLKGNQIHEYAKIIGLADVFEAACHTRKNRKSTLLYESIKKIIDLDENHFSNKIKKALIKQLSLFPKGTIVKLNSGEIGQVIEINQIHPMRPLVEILFDSPNCKSVTKKKRHLKDAPFLFIEKVIDEEDLK